MKKNIFILLISLMLICSCGGIGIIKNTNIDVPGFSKKTVFTELPSEVQKKYLENHPTSVVNGVKPLDSYKSIILIKDDKETDTIDLLYVNREFWTFGLGGMPSRNNKGNVLKSGFHFNYMNKKFYLRDNRSGQPMIIFNDTLYIYNVRENNFMYPYDINRSEKDKLANTKIEYISLKEWL